VTENFSLSLVSLVIQDFFFLKEYVLGTGDSSASAQQ
jgi:hypothetical protein